MGKEEFNDYIEGRLHAVVPAGMPDIMGALSTSHVGTKDIKTAATGFVIHRVETERQKEKRRAEDREALSEQEQARFDDIAVNELLKLARTAQKKYEEQVTGEFSKEEWLEFWQKTKEKYECSAFDQLSPYEIAEIEHDIVKTVRLKRVVEIILLGVKF